MRQPTTEEGQIYFITTVTYKRRRSFVRVEQAKTMGGIIINACRMKEFALFAYCIMPDHVHLLVQKDSSSGAFEKAPLRDIKLKGGLSSPDRKIYSLSDLMQSIKGNYSRCIHNGAFWQEGYDARIISTAERMNNTVYYLMYNHQKHGLPDAFGARPFLYHDLRAIRVLM